MTITNIEIFWNDMRRVIVDYPGDIKAENVQILGLDGPPEYRLGAAESWLPMSAIGFNWEFTTTRTEGSYSLEVRDSTSLEIVKLFDFEIELPENKVGQDIFKDVINGIQITRDQVKVSVENVTSWFDRNEININASDLYISPDGKIFNWTDLSEPETGFFKYSNTLEPSRNESGQPWTVYRPPSNPEDLCDLFVSNPTVKKPGINLSDGQITVNATSSANITYSLDGSAFQIGNVFSGLPAGTYVITIVDDSGGTGQIPYVIPAPIPGGEVTGTCSIQTQTVILHEKFLRIPRLNAIEFKIPDNNRPNFNNTLFVDMKLPHRIQENKYCQVYFDTDFGWVQFQSNFDTHAVKIYDYNTGAELATTTPLPVYTSPEGFTYFEFAIDFSLYSGKTIQVRIIPENETLGTGGVGISEPIEVISIDDENKYVKIQYQSNVNCSDVYWVSGFSPFFYIEGDVADTFPAINKEVSRDCEWNTNTQSRELTRLIKVTAKQQPHYIFEKLQWALGNGQGPGNFYSVNDMWVNSEEGAWDEPDFPYKYSLADSEAKLEQRDLFAGDLSETPTAPITINYLLVNPDNNGGLLVGQNDEYELI